MDNLCKEFWKAIKGAENLFEVSNYGKVASINYYNKRIRHVLKPSAKYRYLKVGIKYNDGSKATEYVHRLMMEAFVPNPDELPHINHKDGNKLNNFIWVNDDGTVDLEKSNLEWCTAKENSNNPNTVNNYKNRYHKEGEFERRSIAQKKRFSEGRNKNFAWMK